MLPLDERGRAVEARLKDRYTFEGFLGQGGFAAVYRVRNLRLDRVEALKVLFEARGSDPKFAARFEREARIAASLEHPNVVRVYDFGNADGTFWYSMQYVDGPTLRVQLERHGRMRGEDAAGLLVPLLEALEVVHRGGVVHRDVKPDNIILDADGRPYLMDFGIVKRDDNVHETMEGKILGTPGYLSPEQLRGHPLDGRSDLYAAGVTLYQMLTGEIPFRSDDRIVTMTRRLTEDPEPPSAKARDLEPELERIVLKALARERENRFATAAEMRAALEAFLAARGRPRVRVRVPCRASAPVPHPPRRQRTRPTARACSPPRSRPRRSHRGRRSRRVPLGRPSGLRPAPRSSSPPLVRRRSLRSRGDGSPSLRGAAPPGTHGTPKARRGSRESASPWRRSHRPSSPPRLPPHARGRPWESPSWSPPTGSLKSSRVVSKAAPECDAAALEAVSHYRFRAERDEYDRPVEGRLSLSVRY